MRLLIYIIFIFVNNGANLKKAENYHSIWFDDLIKCFDFENKLIIKNQKRLIKILRIFYWLAFS